MHTIKQYNAMKTSLSRTSLIAILFLLCLFVSFHPSSYAQEIPSETVRLSSSQPLEKKRRFHIMLGYVFTQTQANGNVVSAFKASGFGGTSPGFFGEIDYPTNNNNPFSWGIGVDYSVADRFRLGIGVSGTGKQEINGMDFTEEDVRAYFLRGYADYVAIPANPRLVHPYEVAVGVGGSYNWLSVDGNLSIHSPLVPNVTPSTFDINKAVGGWNARGSLDYYLSKTLSLQLKLEFSVMKAVDVPSVTYVNPNTGKAKTLKSHSVDFSGFDVKAGLRLHL